MNAQLGDICDIQNIRIPAYISPNTPFIIRYDGVNVSAEKQTLFGYMIDAAEQQIPNSYWIKRIHPSQAYTSTVNLSGVDETFEGQILLGYGEGVPGVGVAIVAIAIITATIAYYCVKKKK